METHASESSPTDISSLGQQAVEKLIDVLRREESAILSGRWEKLAPLERLRAKWWKALDAALSQGLPVALLKQLRDQTDANTRLLTKALLEVGQKLSGARQRSRAAQAYSRESAMGATGIEIA